MAIQNRPRSGATARDRFPLVHNVLPTLKQSQSMALGHAGRKILVIESDDDSVSAPAGGLDIAHRPIWRAIICCACGGRAHRQCLLSWTDEWFAFPPGRATPPRRLFPAPAAEPRPGQLRRAT